MEIKELVKIICDELGGNVDIFEHNDPKNDLVYYEEDIVYTRSNLPISLYSSEDVRDYKKKKYIEDTYNPGNLEFDIELFTAIDSIIENIYECTKKELINMVNICAGRVRKEITNKLDFEEIRDMKDLIETVKNDKYFSTLYFVVRHYSCSKENQYRFYNTKPVMYKFGNTEYNRALDVVDIEIFDDFTSLHFKSEGSKHHDDKTDNKNSIEKQILYALNIWNSYYRI